MEWQKGRESTNVVQSNRGSSYRGHRSPLRLGRFPLGIGGLLTVVVVSVVLGFDPIQVLSILSVSSSDPYTQSSSPATSPVASDDPQVKFEGKRGQAPLFGL